MYNKQLTYKEVSIRLENKVTGELFTTITLPSSTMKAIKRISKKKGISEDEYVNTCIRNGLRIMEMRDMPHITVYPFITVREWLVE